MSIHEATIEEFEQGGWIADIISDDAFDGTFQLNDGSRWTGTKFSARNEILHFTRVVGGKGNLSKALQDKFYSGNVSLQVAVSDICNEGGERLGTVTPGVFLSTYQRLKGTVAVSLSVLAEEFGMIWWIDRDGLVNMAKERPSAPDATGNRKSIDTDASIVLSEPQGVVLGASYGSSDPSLAMPKIRHVRWRQKSDLFTAEIYPLPFLFRSPTVTIYDRISNARVDRDNGDNTIDVIVEARFGVKAVPYFCGVPHSKAKLSGGDQVVFGFFGGNPNAPFAFCASQDLTATKQVARNGDSVQITVSAADIAALGMANSGGPVTGVGGTLNGQITSGSDRLKVGD